MSNYKMIVMDMDDTLINSENKVSKETKNYLIDIQNQGYKVVLASGRPTEGMLPIAKELQLDIHDSYIISYNGGKTIKVATEEVEVSQSVFKKNFDLIVDFCREHNLKPPTNRQVQTCHKTPAYILEEKARQWMKR